MNKLIAIGQASKLLGVTIQTLRNWDKQGLLKPDEITKGGSRRYKLESLKNINKKGIVAKAISDVSLYEFKRQLQYKSDYHKREIIEADTFYPSSKTCSKCGSIKETLTLKERIYECENCGLKIDRDYNASLNLYNLIPQKIGQVLSEFTPADLMALQYDLAINNIATSKVETGIQQKNYV